jgi:hypothetical protein
VYYCTHGNFLIFFSWTTANRRSEDQSIRPSLGHASIEENTYNTRLARAENGSPATALPSPTPKQFATQPNARRYRTPHAT